MNKRTLNSFISHGLDSVKSTELIIAGYNVGSLKALSKKKLVELGLETHQIESLKGDRPPIPTETVFKLLYESNFTCCVCKKPGKGVIIHHLDEFHISKNHDYDNLVVICHEHHDEAHTDRRNSQNLTKDKLKAFKKEWNKFVTQIACRRILDSCRSDGAIWSLINIRRIYEMSEKLEINLKLMPHYYECLSRNYISKDGRILSTIYDRNSDDYVYDLGWDGSKLVSYHEEILEEIISQLNFIDLTNKWSKDYIKNFVTEGSYISLQAAFHFRNNKKNKRSNQLCLATKKSGGISLEITYNSWECTSMSARACHVSGHVSGTILAVVRTLANEDDTIKITATCLAVGTAFPDWKPYKERLKDNSYELIVPMEDKYE